MCGLYILSQQLFCFNLIGSADSDTLYHKLHKFMFCYTVTISVSGEPLMMLCCVFRVLTSDPSVDKHTVSSH